ncbi:hypothetical protein MML48_3g00003997 [Holotrichia oblita]|uniref:Uncharacterized protein n=1 Tax=Holotrichia oblita TaxID=644536 RepID=A0ACB9TF77_HOLOL|nr:hypothetical protein MML48_3g00003997 [Holotrichia oblita]
MVKLTERERSEILCMIVFGDRMRIQQEEVELFNETHPGQPPISQSMNTHKNSSRVPKNVFKCLWHYSKEDPESSEYEDEDGREIKENRGGDHRSHKSSVKRENVGHFIGSLKAHKSHYNRSKSKRLYLLSNQSISNLCKLYNSKATEELKVKLRFFKNIFPLSTTLDLDHLILSRESCWTWLQRSVFSVDRLPKQKYFPATCTTVKDGCSGQNKKHIVRNCLVLWLYKEASLTIKDILVVFPVRGHSYLPADRVFGRVEKDFKETKFGKKARKRLECARLQEDNIEKIKWYKRHEED